MELQREKAAFYQQEKQYMFIATDTVIKRFFWAFSFVSLLSSLCSLSIFNRNYMLILTFIYCSQTSKSFVSLFLPAVFRYADLFMFFFFFQ